jgi:probable F420-dependent oxidoreductase
MFQIAIGLIRLQEWFEGDFTKVIELVRIADQKGIDLVTLTDHLAYSEGINNYPHGKFKFELDTPFYEPIPALAAMAAVTRRIRLSTSVMIGPLRPALLLAKQLATLDVLSKGRVEIGLGAGWHREEFDAVGVPFDGRFGYLMEQVDAMRMLWRQAPASFHGKYVDFDGLYSLPFPVQPGGIPVVFGLGPSERNFERIAAHGDGWAPIERDPQVLARMIGSLRAAFVRRGRDPATLKVRVMPEGTSSAAMEKIERYGKLDLEETAARIPALLRAGVTQLEFQPAVWVDGPRASKLPSFRGENMSVTVVVDLTIKPDEADAYCTRLQTAFLETRAQQGFEAIGLYRDVDKANRILVIERWAQRADYERYVAWRREQGVFDRLATISEVPMQVTVLNEVR